ncbi:hypothetical protein [Pseudoalteromonas luteoviolacea]|uniref:Uncharacterized protein n=1 Tax=Pseudoalteromonas luteoviolacea S4054 TaxID=1129367 RepID=A0A0F6AHP0_9GAMM|nr:hypothetical protein [Pseudoalteromonas luteoviolacea]AOT06988.1 hypothetical protein S4054249_03450 [Pseudoalteromonas luteoviolacea]AOT11906.1 hypothetical protein S40542_03450 [Pseudoalteromonas luteoviolacea]AOT16818.1 hypothetical protein S4054_03450 [Pseudoalteromonas luteoviolacea]KKE85673.1 hypothetical protein N479_25275 [Pseudoalteromonas luteoviolacea S4054]KZN78416.1 hypothetical protein N481_26060 [Pseudoalteromonas luteoviolacea S4047-1]
MGSENQIARTDKIKKHLILLILTVLGTVIPSVITYYLIAPSQLEQKSYDGRLAEYNRFIELLRHERYKNISLLISLKSMAENVTSDSSIQQVEDAIFVLHNDQEIHRKISEHFSILVLNDSNLVRLYRKDLMHVFWERDFNVDWGLHSESVQLAYEFWAEKERKKVGLNPKVEDEIRAKFMIISWQYDELINLLKYGIT